MHGDKMNIFEVLGPIMVGPSSSHTAGAVRIGYVSLKLLGEKPRKAKIFLHGSFASTGTGHGTPKALIAGLLGMETDDMRIPNSFAIAEENGLQFEIHSTHLKGAHPNTALLKLLGEKGKLLEIQASSLGGGRIKIDQIDGIEVGFTGENPTLIIQNIDKPGYAAEVTSILAKNLLNVATLQLYRDKKGGLAVMVAETDQPIPEEAINHLKVLHGILKVTYLDTKNH